MSAFETTGPAGADGAADAASVTFTPAGGIVATDVQAALVELDTEKASTGSVTALDTRLDVAEVKALYASWWMSALPDATGAFGPVWEVPEVPAGGVETFTLERAHARLETPITGATSLIVELQKSVGGGAFTAVAITTLTLATGVQEVSDTTGLGTVDSGDLLRLSCNQVGGAGGVGLLVNLKGAFTP